MAEQDAQPQESSASTVSTRTESVIPGTFWVQKNTFLEVEEPPVVSGIQGMRRSHSAPPSTSGSSQSASGTKSSTETGDSGLACEAEAGDMEDDEGALDGELLGDDADEEEARTGKRPGKAYRLRYKALTKDVMNRLRRDPTIDLEEDIVLPPWLAKDTWLRSRFLSRMGSFQQKMLAKAAREAALEGEDQGAPATAAAPAGATSAAAPHAKRAASRGAPKSSPKRQCRSAGQASSSSSWPGPATDGAAGSPQSQSSSGRERKIMQL